MRLRTRLRVEHGGTLDRERGLFDGDALAPRAWGAAEDPGQQGFALDHGHVLADVEHLLLGFEVVLRGGEPEVRSTLRLEGHPLGRLGDRLAQGGRLARAAHRLTNAAGKQVHEVVDIFSSPVALRRFALAVRRGGLSRRQKRTLLFLVLLTSVWLWLVGLAGLSLAGSASLDEWSILWSLYFASLLTNLFLPVPIEAVALTASLSVGALGAALACGAGKAVGAWIIYSLGPVLRRAMARLEARSLLTRRILVGAQRFTARFGYLALLVMIAVPFSPLDIVPVYLFSVMGLRLKPFLAAIFLGFAARVYVVAVFGAALLRLLGVS
jgi:hypothetical protein